MPQIFKFGPYRIYFWTNENKPLEPIHVHIASGRPAENATKIWITKNGKCYLCHNKSKIPDHILKMMRLACHKNKNLPQRQLRTVFTDTLQARRPVQYHHRKYIVPQTFHPCTGVFFYLFFTNHKKAPTFL